MNRKVSVLLVLILLFSFGLSVTAAGIEIPGYEGGIQNEMTYQEVIFITGKPILMSGTLTLRRSERNNRITETYTYRLENLAEAAEMDRRVTIYVDVVQNGQQQQEFYTVNSYRESVEVAGVEYETNQNSSQWSKSKLLHNKPGVTYFAGNWDGRKRYTVNDGEAVVTVTTTGEVVGYEQNWGKTETQILNHYIQYTGTGDEAVSWQGTARVEAVHNQTTHYSYEANSPTQISFTGGYLLTQQEENVLKYSYDLPRLGEDGSLLSQRNVGTHSFSLDTNPVNKRLTIPAFRDILSHWAERDIMLLASLGAVGDQSSTYFGPGLPMSRADFAKAIAVVMGLVSETTTTTTTTPRRSLQVEEEAGLFLDVSKADPYEKYIRAVYEKGIMFGDGKGSFLPSSSVTKAEAVTILVRLLGFENHAPIQSYSTGFRDDGAIPNWAKDAVYVTKELGLISGTPDNYFQPQRAMTKAEAVTMLTNLIGYLQQDLRFDYRERILNY